MKKTLIASVIAAIGSAVNDATLALNHGCSAAN